MTNNMVIRLVTFAVIIFCFFAMFLTASLSMHADLRPASSDFSPIAISADAVQHEAQLSTLSAADPAAGIEVPSL